ncbi:MAG: MOSC domain-containing protein [Pseudomonadales bacterium]|nr:MOSC domain-containing protein [Pseudomonadales bacterium]MBO6596512.1 MOSC domain-containing protein [Pseudomonadales bacterium]MBO6823499.1 MOSC domain-containing protein [Pseudomonadales bacterium]
MRIERVSTAERIQLQVGNRKVQTGIFKRARNGAVPVNREGLEGDAICNRKHHGGPDQAVYLYASEDYEFWARQLNGDMTPGTFGENLTVSGIDLRAVCPGDRLRSESLTLEITAPRIPCHVLAARMDDRTFAKKFVQANRSGAYCRVIDEGKVSAGDEFAHLPFGGDRIPLARFFVDAQRGLSADTLRRYLAAPIDTRTRREFEKDLKKRISEGEE